MDIYDQVYHAVFPKQGVTSASWRNIAFPQKRRINFIHAVRIHESWTPIENVSIQSGLELYSIGLLETNDNPE
jgi:hypothetical protein